MNKLLRIIMSLCFVLAIFLTCVDYCCFDKDFYETEQEKYAIGETIGISSKEDMKTLTDVTVDYLRDRSKTLDLKLNVKGVIREVYNAKEKSHMEDVRDLYLNAMLVRNISFILFVLILINNIIIKTSVNDIFVSYRNTLFWILIIFGAIGIMVYSNFDEFWYNFHLVFFDNMNWLLDSRVDILVMFVPSGFFNDLVIRILFMVLSAIVSSFIALVIVRKYAN